MGVRISLCPLMRNIMFKSGWSDYEESNYIIIWEQNGSYFIKEEGHKHGFSIEYCPICQFEVLDDRDALKYLYHVLGHSNKDILEDIKKKYGDYYKFIAEMNIIISKKCEEEKIKKEEKKIKW